MNTAADAQPGHVILCLVTDAYGGTGGIALYNRDVMQALAADPENARIVCLPRIAPNPREAVPAKVENDESGLDGKLAYLRAVIRQARSAKPDLIHCAHANLIPLARLASGLSGAPWVLCMYGTEAWQPFGRALSREGVRSADGVIAVSQVTLDRFLGWCPELGDRATVVHNAIHLDQFSPQPKDPALERRYGIEGRTVIMTVGRLDASEQLKGFDRVIAILPELARAVPDICYMIVGKGDDRPNLEALAREHGVSDRVIFTGFISEEEKAAHYNLADAYVMPSVGEGFGYVFIEALACGVPCVASNRDGGQEAVLHGELGAVVDPFDRQALVRAIVEAIAKPKHVPERLRHFSYDSYAIRLNAALREVIARRKG